MTPAAGEAKGDHVGAGAITSLRDIAAHPGLGWLLLQQARRGVRVQWAVRLALAVLLLLTVVLLPPETQRVTCVAIASGYLAWSVLLAVLLGVVANGAGVVRYAWLALFVDLAAVTAITVASGLEAVTWTAGVLTFAFFVIPVLAATQLRPWVCAAVCAPTVALYVAAAVISRVANGDEPWPSIWLRAAVLALVCVGAVALCRVELARVIGLAQLAADRLDLVGQLVTTEERERQELSEHLHDGALQYVLAAKMDLGLLDGQIDAGTQDRLDRALTTSARMLRSTVSELNPAVLASAGLPPALADLAAESGRRGGFTADVEAGSWPASGTTADGLLFTTARELLANVVKHAGSSAVSIQLGFDGTTATLTVDDNGRGLADGEADRKLAQGHVGLHSRRVRVQAAGGELRVSSLVSGGTRVGVTVPATVLSH